MYDYVIIGSGFGGSVSALRLSEKGYKVLVIEKGYWKKPEDFPRTNWNLKKWMWLPSLGFKGIFKLTIFRHLSVVSGVGVGGGSLVYANTLPKPKSLFFNSGSWNTVDDWEVNLAPFYKIAYKMLGANINPKLFQADEIVKEIAVDEGKLSQFGPAKVAIYFGKADETVNDPYFNGQGPDRKGCNFCGQCMTGCPHNAKNTLDKNYLYLAQKNGVEILAGHQVVNIIPQPGGTYIVEYKKTNALLGKKKSIRTKGIVFAGGVLGTIPLLLKLKNTTMPDISDRVGMDVRSNNESLIFVTTPDKNVDMTKGIAIGSIYNISEHSHLEPVRYGTGSGFWRLLVLPMISEPNAFKRFLKLILSYLKNPLKWIRISWIRNYSKHTAVLLYMEDLEGKLRFKRGFFGLKTSVQDGNPPSAYIPRAHDLAQKYARKINGVCQTFMLESLAGIPSTAHILGGAVIGIDKKSGVIDKNQSLFGYNNIYVCDGSAVSANPGVNPALTITAMTEYAMSKIPNKK